MDNHKKAIETAVELVKNGKISREAAEKIFPELRKSEDERIIQFFAELATDACGGPGQEYYEELGLNYDKVMAWLKKQKEQKPTDISSLRDWKFIVDAVLTEHEGIGQYLDKPETERIAKKLQERFSLPQSKPAEWSEKDKLWLSEVYFAIDHSMYSETKRQAMKKYIDYLRYQSQPKPAEWSEEDKDMLSAIEYCVKTKRALAEEHYKWIEEKLKSIRPYWIPTDKQMESIRYLLEDYAPWTISSREARQDLRAVYNELLKYKEK